MNYKDLKEGQKVWYSTDKGWAVGFWVGVNGRGESLVTAYLLNDGSPDKRELVIGKYVQLENPYK